MTRKRRCYCGSERNHIINRGLSSFDRIHMSLDLLSWSWKDWSQSARGRRGLATAFIYLCCLFIVFRVLVFWVRRLQGHVELNGNEPYHPLNTRWQCLWLNHDKIHLVGEFPIMRIINRCLIAGISKCLRFPFLGMRSLCFLCGIYWLLKKLWLCGHMDSWQPPLNH